jgi:hypothetical protein
LKIDYARTCTIPISSIVADSATATGLKWAAPATPTFIGCSASFGAAQSISNTTDTLITWDTEQYDTSGFHSNVTNNSRMTIPTGLGGYYLIRCTISMDAYAGGSRITIKKNAGASRVIGSFGYTSASYTTPMVMGIFNLSAADYIYAEMYQNTGGSVLARGNDLADSSFFQIQYLGA